MLLTGILLIFSLQAVKGSTITWKSIGPNLYEFKVLLFADSSSTWPTNVTIEGPNSIHYSLAGSSISYIGDTCAVSVYGVYKIREYVGVIVLNGTPPYSGWVFKFYNCCGFTNVINTTGQNTSSYIEARMYPGGQNLNSPQFDSEADFRMSKHNRFFLPHSSIGQLGDSLYYSLVSPMYLQSSARTFSSGFSATSPLPNPLSNPLNGPIYFDRSIGYMQFNIHTATAGEYYFATEVEQWRNGILTAKVMRDLPASFLVNPNPVANSQPTVEIDTSVYDVQRLDDIYTMAVRPGDTAHFEINATDFDLNGSNFQNLTFKAKGQALDVHWNSTSFYTSTAHLQPVSPQLGFTSPGSNNISFEWIVANEHVDLHPVEYVFFFEVKDDASCALSSKKIVIVKIQVEPVLGVAPDTLAICQGDSVLLKGTTPSKIYFWENADVSFTSTKRYVYVSPNQSGYFFLKDGASQNVVDSVYINVTELRSFSLNQGAAGLLYVIDSNGLSNFNWYFNSVLIQGNSSDTLLASKRGSYYVTARLGSCLLVSKDITISQIFGIGELDLSSVQLYPNPAKSQVLISNLVSVQKVYLVDVTGQVHQEIRATKGQSEVLVSRQSLPSGVYFLKMEFDEGNTLVKKVVFE